jgi:hypothetical protein
MTNVEKVSKSIKETMRFNPDSLSYANEVFYSSPCPQCDMKIYKIDGCDHMVCQKCKFEFCWLCLGHYPGYVHSGVDTICGLRPIMKGVNCIMMFIMLFSYFLYTSTYVSYLLKIFLTVTLKLVFANLFATSLLLTLVFSHIYILKYNRYYGNSLETFTMCGFAALIMAWPMVWAGLAASWYFKVIPGNFVVRYLYNEVYYALIIVLLAMAIG